MDYEVVSITTLTMDGGRLDWSPDGNWIAYDRKEGDGYYDIYRIHPDGSGDECLTCDHPNLPRDITGVQRHQGNPDWHPSAPYLLFQVEKSWHLLDQTHNTCEPGRGTYNDLWVMDLGSAPPYAVYRLTNVNPLTPAGGSLHAHFSSDGTKLLWTDLEGSADNGCYGNWKLAVADLVLPYPHLENIQNFEPAELDDWYECHDWGQDDSSVYCTCMDNPGMHESWMDICRMDFSEPNDVTRLTLSSGTNGEPKVWDEHSHISPLGDAISYMSSKYYPAWKNCYFRIWLKTEIWLMNMDGSSPRRITYFNDPGHPHYLGRTAIGDNDWNPAATGNQQLAMVMYVEETDSSHIKIIEFAR